MTTLQDIQKRATALSECRDRLSTLFLTLQGNLDTVKNGSMAEIKRVARQVAREHNELVAAINAHPELFEKPRTYVVEGIKFGMQASQGSLEWADDDKVCERIAALAAAGDIPADQVELLVTVTKKPGENAVDVAGAVRLMISRSLLVSKAPWTTSCKCFLRAGSSP